MQGLVNQIENKIDGAVAQVSNLVQGKGIYALDNAQGVYIKQKFELLEAVTGCETENKYDVFEADMNGNLIPGKPALFQCREKSGCVQRQCCPGACRPMTLNLFDAELCINMKPTPEQAFMTANKPFKCTFWCLNRPIMEISQRNHDGSLQYLGKVIHKFSCCSLDFEIRDQNDQKLFGIHGSCMQLGWLCKEFPCKPCQQMKFELSDASNVQIGTITKKSSGCLKAFCGDVDDFTIGFPANLPKEHKALILYVMLMIDFQYFEEKGAGNK